MDPNDLKLALEVLYAEAILILSVLVATLWVKDLAQKIAKGIMFRLSPLFKEGDTVLLDGEEAVIVKIGFSNTVFGLHRSNGTHRECWRIVSNDRLTSLKIEKVINTHPAGKDH